MTGFIKNTDALEEGHKVEDLLDFSSEVQRLNDAVARIPRSSLIGYVGKFGSGKSTTIYQLQKQFSTDKTSKWFEFDAWKYPERKDLWENFVLDIADQLGGRKRAQRKIEGKETKSAVVDITTDIVGAGMELMEGIAGSASEYLGKAAEKLQIADKLVGIFKRSSARRVFEIQELLSSMISALKEDNIFIIVEDLDRSGDAGRYFLETLRQFIKNNLPEKRIIVLVPIGTEVYDKNPEHRASYQKALDYIFFFSQTGINFSRFIDEVFEATAFPETTEIQPHVSLPTPWKAQLVDWFGIAINNGLTVREIKVALRFADLAHANLCEQGYEADPRIVLAFTLLNHIFTEGGTRWISRITTQNPIGNNCPIFLFLQAISCNEIPSTFNTGRWMLAPTELVRDNKFKVPTYQDSRRQEKEGVYFLSSFYLIPFGQKPSF